MPAIGESRSRTSLFDFFDERKSRVVKTTISLGNIGTTEASSPENEAVRDAVAEANDVETLLIKGGDKTVACPSESEKALLDWITEKGSDSIRSKTSENKVEVGATRRTVKSDNAFTGGLRVDFPDIEGSGDPVSFGMVHNDDDGVQIDIIIERGDSENGDRSTAVTDAMQSVEFYADAIVSEDGGTSLSGEKSDVESDNEDKKDQGDTFKDLDEAYDSESDESEVTHSESVGSHYDKNIDVDDDTAIGRDFDGEVDGCILNDNGDEEGDFSSYCSNGSDEKHESCDEGPGGIMEDQEQPECSNQTSESSEAQCDTSTEDENESRGEKSLAKTRDCEHADYVWVDFDWETSYSDGDDDNISGLRETFTPYQAMNNDDPGEGNRPESDGTEILESNAFQTRINKTDGEAWINIPLSTSFIMRHKRSCILEGARTVSELMMALQRKRLNEIAHEGRRREQIRTQANLQHETAADNREKVRNQTEAQGVEEPEKSVHVPENNQEQQRDENLTTQQKENRGRTSKKTVENRASEASKMQSSGKSSQKTNVKDSKAGLAKRKLDITAKTKPLSKNGKTKALTHSAAHLRIPDKFTQQNIWKGPKPVLPAISKGTARSAPQTLPPPKTLARSKTENNARRQETKTSVNHRKPTPDDTKYRVSPDVRKTCSPRKTALPSIPMQLRSNAWYRDGKLEVEVMCDDRLNYSSDPLEVKVTFVHKHLYSSKLRQPTAYKTNFWKKPDKIQNWISAPTNRDIIQQRALWPPFNTHVDPEASERHVKIFGNV